MQVLSKFFSQFSLGAGTWFFFWVLAILMVFSLAIFFERLAFVNVKSHLNSEKFMNAIYDFVKKGDLGRASQLAGSVREKALGFVVFHALKEAEGKDLVDYRSIQNAVDEATLQVLPKLSRRTPWLSTIANVATLWGLMGTIWGLIMSFDAVAHAGANASQALAGGISIAMLTTLGGLFVAVPTLLMFSWINNSTNSLIEDIDEHAVKLVNIMTGTR